MEIVHQINGRDLFFILFFMLFFFPIWDFTGLGKKTRIKNKTRPQK